MEVMVAVDIETTGLDPVRNNICQIGMIAFNPWSKEEYGRWWFDCNPEGFNWTLYCLKLHKDWLENIIKRIDAKDNYRIASDEGVLVARFVGQYKEWCNNFNKGDKITVVGKNFGRFDWRFLNAKGLDDRTIPVRSADPTILFYQRTDQRLPELGACVERATQKPHKVAHTALADCEDVITCIRAGLAKQYLENRSSS